jgi:hypothetical protein
MTSKKISSAHIKKFEKYWGVHGWDSYQRIAQGMHERGFVNVTSHEKNSETITLIHFIKDITSTIRAVISCSVLSYGLNTTSRFSSKLFFMSKTVYDKTLASDPWQPSLDYGCDKWNEGYVFVYLAALSHCVWCEIKDFPHNPSFKTIEDTTGDLRYPALFPAIDRHFIPVINRVQSDADLVCLLQEALVYKKPDWVLSDGPSAPNIRELIQCFLR